MGRDHFYLIGFQAPSSLALNIFRDGTFTTSLVSLWPCITTITVNNFFLISDLNCFYFKAIPAYPGIPCSCQKSFSSSLVAHLGTGRSCKIFRKASPLWAEQPVSVTGEEFHLSNHICGRFWALSKRSMKVSLKKLPWWGNVRNTLDCVRWLAFTCINLHGQFLCPWARKRLRTGVLGQVWPTTSSEAAVWWGAENYSSALALKHMQRNT